MENDDADTVADVRALNIYNAPVIIANVVIPIFERSLVSVLL
jgi:hypothetical protein